MASGYIYCFSNESMSDVYKIGFTTRSPIMVYPHNFIYNLLYVIKKVSCYHICIENVLIILLIFQLYQTRYNYADKP
jgi:hypothetical protein